MQTSKKKQETLQENGQRIFIKRFSTSPVIKSKVKQLCVFLPSKLTKIRKLDRTKWWWGCTEETPQMLLSGVNWVSTGEALSKINSEVLHESDKVHMLLPSNFIPSYTQKIWKQQSDRCIYTSIFTKVKR